MRIVRDDAGSPTGRCAGAGVLGFCAPHSEGGEVYFLLGKERNCPSWRYGSDRWSDFAGSCKDGEAPEQTAAREFVEETMGVVPSAGGVADLALALERGEHSLKVVVTIESGEHESKHHITYVKRVPWCPQMPEVFEATRSALLRLHEMCDLAHRQTARAAEMLEGSPCAAAMGEPRRRPAAATLEGDVLRVAGWGPREAATACWTIATPAERVGAAALAVAVQRWDAAVRFWEGLAPSIRVGAAVAVERAPDGRPVSIRVSADYLEKQCIQLWSRTRLEEVVRGAGYFRGDHFRPCFLPTLAAVLDEFAGGGGDGPDANVFVRALITPPQIGA